MTTTDDAILAAILRREGGFVNHPADRGGPTHYGITQATLQAWRGRAVSEEDVRALSVEEAKAIYRARYLAPFTDVVEALRPQVVDIAVNSGVGRARALLNVAQQQNQRPVAVQLVIERLRFYARLVEKRPSQAVFLPGWINRAVEFL
jgi:lysozyme family protein